MLVFFCFFVLRPSRKAGADGGRSAAPGRHSPSSPLARALSCSSTAAHTWVTSALWTLLICSKPAAEWTWVLCGVEAISVISSASASLIPGRKHIKKKNTSQCDVRLEVPSNGNKEGVPLPDLPPPRSTLLGPSSGSDGHLATQGPQAATAPSRPVPLATQGPWAVTDRP